MPHHGSGTISSDLANQKPKLHQQWLVLEPKPESKLSVPIAILVRPVSFSIWIDNF